MEDNTTQTVQQNNEVPYSILFAKGLSTPEIYNLKKTNQLYIKPPNQDPVIEAENLGMIPEDPNFLNLYEASKQSFDMYQRGMWNGSHYSWKDRAEVIATPSKYVPRYDPNKRFSSPNFVSGYSEADIEFLKNDENNPWNADFMAQEYAKDRGYVINRDGTKENFTGHPFYKYPLELAKEFLGFKELKNFYLALDENYFNSIFSKTYGISNDILTVGINKDDGMPELQYKSMYEYVPSERIYKAWGHDSKHYGWLGNTLAGFVNNFLEWKKLSFQAALFFYNVFSNEESPVEQLNKLQDKYYQTAAAKKSGLLDYNGPFIYQNVVNDEIKDINVYDALNPQSNMRFSYADEVLHDFVYKKPFVHQLISSGLNSGNNILIPAPREKTGWYMTGSLIGMVIGLKGIGGFLKSSTKLTASQSHNLSNAFFGLHSAFAFQETAESVGADRKHAAAIGLALGAAMYGMFGVGSNLIQRGVGKAYFSSIVKEHAKKGAQEYLGSIGKESLSQLTKVEEAGLIRSIANKMSKIYANPKTYTQALLAQSTTEAVKFGGLNAIDEAILSFHDQYLAAKGSSPGDGMFGETGEDYFETFKGRWHDATIEGLTSGFLTGLITVAGQALGRSVNLRTKIDPATGKKTPWLQKPKFIETEDTIATLILRNEGSTILDTYKKMHAKGMFHNDTEINDMMYKAAVAQVDAALFAKKRMKLDNPQVIMAAGELSFMKEALKKGMEREALIQELNNPQTDAARKGVISKDIERLNQEIADYTEPTVGGKYSKKWAQALKLMQLSVMKYYDPVTNQFVELVSPIKSADGTIKKLDITKAWEKVLTNEKLIEEKNLFIQERLDSFTERKNPKSQLSRAEQSMQEISIIFDSFKTGKPKKSSEIRNIKNEVVKRLSDIKIASEEALRYDGSTKEEKVQWESLLTRYSDMAEQTKSMIKETAEYFDGVSKEVEQGYVKDLEQKYNESAKAYDDVKNNPNSSKADSDRVQATMIEAKRQYEEALIKTENDPKYKEAIEGSNEVSDMEIDLLGMNIDTMEITGDKAEMPTHLRPEIASDDVVRQTEQGISDYQNAAKSKDGNTPIIEQITNQFNQKKLDEFKSEYGLETEAFVLNFPHYNITPNFEYMINKAREKGLEVNDNNLTDIINKYYDTIESQRNYPPERVKKMRDDYAKLVQIYDYVTIEHVLANTLAARHGGVDFSTDPMKMSTKSANEYKVELIKISHLFNDVVNHAEAVSQKRKEYYVQQTVHTINKRRKIADHITNYLVSNIDLMRTLQKGIDTKDFDFVAAIKPLNELMNAFDMYKSTTFNELYSSKEMTETMTKQVTSFEIIFHDIVSNINKYSKTPEVTLEILFKAIGDHIKLRNGDAQHFHDYGFIASAEEMYLGNSDIFMHKPEMFEDDAYNAAVQNAKEKVDFYSSHEKMVLINYLAQISRVNPQEAYHVIKEMRDANVEDPTTIFFNNQQIFAALQVVSKMENPNDNYVLWMDVGNSPIKRDGRAEWFSNAVFLPGYAGVGKTTMVNMMAHVWHRLMNNRHAGKPEAYNKLRVLSVADTQDTAKRVLDSVMGDLNPMTHKNQDIVSRDLSNAISLKEYSENISKYKEFDLVIIDEAQALESYDVGHIRKHYADRVSEDGKITKNVDSTERPLFLFMGDPDQISPDISDIRIFDKTMERLEGVTQSERAGIEDIINSDRVFREAIINRRAAENYTKFSIERNEKGDITDMKGVYIIRETKDSRTEIKELFSEAYEFAKKNNKSILYVVEKASEIDATYKELGIKPDNSVVRIRAFDASDSYSASHIRGIEADYIFVDYAASDYSTVETNQRLLTAVTRAKKFAAYIGPGSSREGKVVDTSTSEFKNSESGKAILEADMANRKDQKAITDNLINDIKYEYRTGEKAPGQDIISETPLKVELESKKSELPKKETGPSPNDGQTKKTEATTKTHIEPEDNVFKAGTKVSVKRGKKIHDVEIPEQEVVINQTIELKDVDNVIFETGDNIRIENVTVKGKSSKRTYEVKFVEGDVVTMSEKEFFQIFGSKNKKYSHIENKVDNPAETEISDNTIFEIIPKAESMTPQQRAQAASEIRDKIRVLRRGYNATKKSNPELAAPMHSNESIGKEIARSIFDDKGIRSDRSNNFRVSYKATRSEDGKIHIELYSIVDGKETKVGELYPVDEKINYTGKFTQSDRNDFITQTKKYIIEHFASEKANDLIIDMQNSFERYNTLLFDIYERAEAMLSADPNNKTVDIGMSDDAAYITSGYAKYGNKTRKLKDFLGDNYELVRDLKTGQPIAIQETFTDGLRIGDATVYVMVKPKGENNRPAFKVEILSPQMALSPDQIKGKVETPGYNLFDLNDKINYNKSTIKSILNWNRSTLTKILDNKTPDWIINSKNKKLLEAYTVIKNSVKRQSNNKDVDLIHEKDFANNKDKLSNLYNAFQNLMIESNSESVNFIIRMPFPIEGRRRGGVKIDFENVNTNAERVLPPELRLSVDNIDLKPQIIKSPPPPQTPKGGGVRGRYNPKIGSKSIISKGHVKSGPNEPAKPMLKSSEGELVTHEQALEIARKELGHEFVDKFFVAVKGDISDGTGERSFGLFSNGMIYYSVDANNMVGNRFWNHEMVHFNITYRVKASEREKLYMSARYLIEHLGENIDPWGMSKMEVEEWIATTENQRYTNPEYYERIQEVYDRDKSRPNVFKLLDVFQGEMRNSQKILPVIRFLGNQYIMNKSTRTFLKDSYGASDAHRNIVYSMKKENDIAHKMIRNIVNEGFDGSMEAYAFAKRMLQHQVFDSSYLSLDRNNTLNIFEAIDINKTDILVLADRYANQRVIINGKEKLIKNIRSKDIDSIDDIYDAKNVDIMQKWATYRLAQRSKEGGHYYENVIKMIFGRIDTKRMFPKEKNRYYEMILEREKVYDEMELFGGENVPKDYASRYQELIIKEQKLNEAIDSFERINEDMFVKADEYEIRNYEKWVFDDGFSFIKNNDFIHSFFSTIPLYRIDNAGKVIHIDNAGNELSLRTDKNGKSYFVTKDSSLQENVVDVRDSFASYDDWVDVRMLDTVLSKIATNSVNPTPEQISLGIKNNFDVFIDNVDSYLNELITLYSSNNKTGETLQKNKRYRAVKSFQYYMKEHPNGLLNQSKDIQETIAEYVIKEYPDLNVANTVNEKFTSKDVDQYLRYKSGIMTERELLETGFEQRFHQMPEEWKNIVSEQFKRALELDKAVNAIRSAMTSIVPLNGTGATVRGYYDSNDVYRTSAHAFKSRSLDENQIKSDIKQSMMGLYDTEQMSIDAIPGPIGEMQIRTVALNASSKQMFSEEQYGLKITTDESNKTGKIKLGNDGDYLLEWGIDDSNKFYARFNPAHNDHIRSIELMFRRLGIPYRGYGTTINGIFYNTLGSDQIRAITTIKAMANDTSYIVPNRKMLAETLALSALAAHNSAEIANANEMKSVIQRITDNNTPVFVNEQAQFIFDSLQASGYKRGSVDVENSTDVNTEWNTNTRLNYLPTDFFKHLDSLAMYESNILSHSMNKTFRVADTNYLNYMLSSAITSRFNSKVTQESGNDLLYNMAAAVYDRVQANSGGKALDHMNKDYFVFNVEQNPASFSNPFFRAAFKPFKKGGVEKYEYMTFESMEHFLGIEGDYNDAKTSNMTTADYIVAMVDAMYIGKATQDHEFQRRGVAMTQFGKSSKTVNATIKNDKDSPLQFNRDSDGNIKSIYTDKNYILYGVDSVFQMKSKQWAMSLARNAQLLRSGRLNLPAELQSFVNKRLSNLGKFKDSKNQDVDVSDMTVYEIIDNIYQKNDLIQGEGVNDHVRILKTLEETMTEIISFIQYQGGEVVTQNFRKAIKESFLRDNIDYIDNGGIIELGKTARFKFDDVYKFDNYYAFNQLKKMYGLSEKDQVDIAMSFINEIFGKRLRGMIDTFNKYGYKIPAELQSSDIFKVGEDASGNPITGFSKRAEMEIIDAKERNDIIFEKQKEYGDSFFQYKIRKGELIASLNEAKRIVYKDKEGKEVGLNDVYSEIQNNIADLRRKVQEFYITRRGDGEAFKNKSAEDIYMRFEELLINAKEKLNTEDINLRDTELANIVDNIIETQLAHVMIYNDGAIRSKVKKYSKTSPEYVVESIKDEFKNVMDIYLPLAKKHRSKDTAAKYHPLYEFMFYEHHIVNSGLSDLLRGDTNAHKDAITYYKQSEGSVRQGYTMALDTLSGIGTKSRILPFKAAMRMSPTMQSLFGEQATNPELKGREAWEAQGINKKLDLIKSNADMFFENFNGSGFLNPVTQRLMINSLGGETFGRMGEGLAKFFASQGNDKTGEYYDLKYGLQPINADYINSAIGKGLLNVMLGPRLFRVYESLRNDGLTFDQAIDGIVDMVIYDRATNKNIETRLENEMIDQIVPDSSIKGMQSKMLQIDLTGADQMQDVNFSNFVQSLNNIKTVSDYNRKLDEITLHLDNKNILFQLNPEQDVTKRQVAASGQLFAQIRNGNNNIDRGNMVDNILAQITKITFAKHEKDIGISKGQIDPNKFLGHLKNLVSDASSNMREFGMLMNFLSNDSITAENPGFAEMALQMFYSRMNEGIKLKTSGIRHNMQYGGLFERVRNKETGKIMFREQYEKLYGSDMTNAEVVRGLEDTKYYVKGTKQEITNPLELRKLISENKVDIKHAEAITAFSHVNEFFNGDKTVRLKDVMMMKVGNNVIDFDGMSKENLYSTFQNNLSEIVTNLHPRVQEKLNEHLSLLSESNPEWRPLLEGKEPKNATQKRMQRQINDTMIDYLTEYYNSLNEVLDTVIVRIPVEGAPFVTRARIVEFSNFSSNSIHTADARMIRDGTDFDGDQLSVYFRDITIAPDGKIVIARPDDISGIKGSKDIKELTNSLVDVMLDYHNDPMNIERKNMLAGKSYWIAARNDALRKKATNKYDQPNDFASSIYMRDAIAVSNKLIGIAANSVHALSRLGGFDLNNVNKNYKQIIPTFMHNKDNPLEYKTVKFAYDENGKPIIDEATKKPVSYNYEVTSEQLTQFDFKINREIGLLDILVDNIKLHAAGPIGLNENNISTVIAMAWDTNAFPTITSLAKKMNTYPINRVFSKLEFGNRLLAPKQEMTKVIFDTVDALDRGYRDNLESLVLKYQNVFESKDIDNSARKSIIKWLTEEKFIAPKDIARFEGSNKISFDKNDYVTIEMKDANGNILIKGLDAINMETNFKEAIDVQNQITELIGTERMKEQVYKNPGGLLKYYAQGEFIRRLSSVLSLYGGMETKSYDVYKQMKTLELNLGVSLDDFVKNNATVTEPHSGRGKINEALFNKHIERLMVGKAADELQNIKLHEKMIFNIGDIAVITKNLPNIAEYIVYLKQIDNAIKNSIFVKGEFVTSLLERIRINNQIGPMLYDKQYYKAVEGINDVLISSYYTFAPSSERNIKVGMIDTKNMEPGIKLFETSIDLKTPLGQGYYVASFAKFIDNIKTVFENKQIKNDFVERITVNNNYINFRGVNDMTPGMHDYYKHEYKKFLRVMEHETGIKDYGKALDRQFQVYQIFKSRFSGKSSDVTSIIGMEESAKITNFISRLKTDILTDSTKSKAAVETTEGTMPYYKLVKKQLESSIDMFPVRYPELAIGVNKANSLEPTKKPKYVTYIQRKKDYYNRAIAELKKSTIDAEAIPNYFVEYETEYGTAKSYHQVKTTTHKGFIGIYPKEILGYGDAIVSSSSNVEVIKDISYEMYQMLYRSMSTKDMKYNTEKAIEIANDDVVRNQDVYDRRLTLSLDYINKKDIRSNIRSGKVDRLILNGEAFEVKVEGEFMKLDPIETSLLNGDYRIIPYEVTNVVKGDRVTKIDVEQVTLNRGNMNFGISDNYEQHRKMFGRNIAEQMANHTKSYEIVTKDFDRTIKSLKGDIEVTLQRTTSDMKYPGSDPKVDISNMHHVVRGHVMEQIAAAVSRSALERTATHSYDLPIFVNGKKLKISDYYSREAFDKLKVLTEDFIKTEIGDNKPIYFNTKQIVVGAFKYKEGNNTIETTRAGEIDMLMIKGNKERSLILYDFKSANIKVGSEAWKYYVEQMNRYKAQIESEYGYKVSELVLISQEAGKTVNNIITDIKSLKRIQVPMEEGRFVKGTKIKKNDANEYIKRIAEKIICR